MNLATAIMVVNEYNRLEERIRRAVDAVNETGSIRYDRFSLAEWGQAYKFIAFAERLGVTRNDTKHAQATVLGTSGGRPIEYC